MNQIIKIFRDKTILITNLRVIWFIFFLLFMLFFITTEFWYLENGFLSKIPFTDIKFVTFYPWIIGFSFALIIGHTVIWTLVKVGRWWIFYGNHLAPQTGPTRTRPRARPLPPWLVGIVERSLFTLYVALSPSVGSTILIMAAWVGIKMATGWARSSKLGENDEVWLRWKSAAFISLFGNILSMVFALGGGMICRLSLMKDVPDLEENFILPLLGLFH